MILRRCHITYNVNVDNFTLNQTPESAYILGLLWADGYTIKKSNSVRIDVIEEDFKEFLSIFQKCGNWNICYRTRKNRKPSVRAETSNKPLYKFFVDYGYVKNRNNPNKILTNIPKNFLHYWYRGFFDGDGCIYINNKNYCRQISFSGNYFVDWGFLEDLFENINITKFNKQKVLKYKNMSSSIRICNKLDIISFRDYIYQGNSFGLSRKKNKLFLIK